MEQGPVGEEGRVQGSGFRERGQRSEFRGQGTEGSNDASGGREGIVDAPDGRIGSERNGTASALGERSYRTARRGWRSG